MRKQLGIDHISSVIKSKAQGSMEFILHSPDKFDLRISCDRRDAFLDLLKLRFAHMKPEVTLKVYGVPQPSLRDYHVTPNKRGGIENTPNETLRLPEEEIQGTVDIERESQKKVSTSGKSTATSSVGTTKGKEETKGSHDSDSSSQDSFDFTAPQRKDAPKKSNESDMKSMNSEQDVRY